MNDHPYDDISAFALGSLDEEAQRRLLDHADSCPTCAVLVAESMTGVGALAELEEPRAMTRPLARPDSAAASQQAVTQLRPSRPRFTAFGGWVAAAALAASMLLLLVNLNALRQTPPVPVAALVHTHFTHHQLAGTQGAAKVLQAADGQWIYLLADGLAPGARYDVYVWSGDTKGRLGTFAADGQGRAAEFYATAGLLHTVVIVPKGKAPSDPDALHWP
jgi:anti-sigma factor RsiW